MNIIQIQDDLKGLPDQELIKEVQAPSGIAPVYLLLGELQRREKMRAEHAGKEQPTQTVAEQIIEEAIAPAPPMPMGGSPIPPGPGQAMPPQPIPPANQVMPPNIDPNMLASSGVGALPAPNVGQYAEGGVVGFQDGGMWGRGIEEAERRGIVERMPLSPENVGNLVNRARSGFFEFDEGVGEAERRARSVRPEIPTAEKYNANFDDFGGLLQLLRGKKKGEYLPPGALSPLFKRMGKENPKKAGLMRLLSMPQMKWRLDQDFDYTDYPDAAEYAQGGQIKKYAHGGPHVVPGIKRLGQGYWDSRLNQDYAMPAGKFVEQTAQDIDHTLFPGVSDESWLRDIEDETTRELQESSADRADRAAAGYPGQFDPDQQPLVPDDRFQSMSEEEEVVEERPTRTGQTWEGVKSLLQKAEEGNLPGGIRLNPGVEEAIIGYGNKFSDEEHATAMDKFYDLVPFASKKKEREASAAKIKKLEELKKQKDKSKGKKPKPKKLPEMEVVGEQPKTDLQKQLERAEENLKDVNDFESFKKQVEAMEDIMFSESEYDKEAQERAAKIKDRIQRKEDTAGWEAVTRAGLSMMQGESEFAMTNIGKGLEDGLNAYNESEQKIADLEDKYLEIQKEKASADRQKKLAAIEVTYKRESDNRKNYIELITTARKLESDAEIANASNATKVMMKNAELYQEGEENNIKAYDALVKGNWFALHRQQNSEHLTEEQYQLLKEYDLKNAMLQIMSGPEFQGTVDTTNLEYIGVQPEQTTPQT